MQVQQHNKEVFSSLFEEYYNHPEFFVEHALGHYTWSKQREILRSVRDNEKTAVRACHGSSKTYTAAEVVVWFLNCFRGSKVITTAPVFSQVKELLWAEINKIYMNSRVNLEGECLTTKIKIDEEPDHYAIGFSTDQPQRAEGWHAPAILFIFDEAKGIEPWLWDSVKGLMVGGFCRWLVISTTDGVQVGEQFYKAFKDQKSDWNQIHITAYESPFITGEKFRYIKVKDDKHPENFEVKYVEPEKLAIQIATQKWIDGREEEWGKDSVLVLTKVMGELADIGADTIIKLSQLNRMIENAHDPNFNDEGADEVGADIARGGEDDSLFYRRKGLKITDRKVIPPKDMPPTKRLVYVADELEKFADYLKVEVKIKIDDTGVGGGVVDIMQDRGYTVVPVNFQEKANDPDSFPNTISEMWFQVAKIVHEIAYAAGDRLQAELVNRKHLPLDKKGRRVVESKEDYKKRGFRSPDDADAFLLCFYERDEDLGYVGQSKEAMY